MLKGAAIILMIFHHCFCTPDRYEDYDVSFFPLGELLATDISLYFKICVPIFAFITGYGLYKSYTSQSSTDGLKTTQWVLKRYVKSFSGFWVIFILAFLITLSVSYPQKVYGGDGLVMFVVNAFVDFLGFAGLFGTPTLNGTWWYMSAAAIFIAFIPCAVKFGKRLGFTTLIVAIIALPRLLAVGYPGGTNPYAFLLAVVAGILFARYDLFGAIDRFERRHSGALQSTLIVLGYFVLYLVSYIMYTHISRQTLWEYHFSVAPVMFILIARRVLFRIPGIRHVLSFCGRHATNIFMTHTFIRLYFFEEFTYSFGNMWLIPLVLLLISIAISFVLEGIKKLIRFESVQQRLLGWVDALFKARDSRERA